MYESKVSTVRSQAWDNFSVMRNSNNKLPDYIPIPCPSHPNYSITNICKSVGCIQPLCPECITAHIQLHQQTKKPAKIENIVNTRLGCIQKLAQIVQELNSDYQKYENSCGANLQGLLEKNRKKVEFAKSKIENFVVRYFQELQQKLQLLEVAYLQQREKKSSEMKAKAAPLLHSMEQITQYKVQLESEDYIPALIQILNDPPKKPPTLSKLQFQEYGQVRVDQYAFQTFKTSLQSFINVKSFLPEQNKFSQQISRNSGKFSNQMKFSRLGRSSSRQLVESQLENSRNQMNVSRSNSRKNIFSNQKRPDSISRVNSSSVGAPKQQRQMERISVNFENNYQSVSLIDCNYFLYDKGLLAYFPPNQRYFYAVEALCADRGFQRYQLSEQFVIPDDHQCIITPQSRIFLLGGRINTQFLNDSYEVILKASNRGNSILKKISPMKQAKAKFAAVYSRQFIYVFGGRRGPSILSTCQKYSIQADKWETIKNMPQPLMNMNVCAFNEKIIKFGGILQSGQILNRIDIYNPSINQWMKFGSEIPFFIRMGSCQLNKSEMLIFGGETQFNNRKNQCFLLKEEKKNEFKVYPCLNTLYNQGSFQNAYVYKNSLIAIQNGQDNKNKIIMKLQSGKWRFLSC